MIEGIEEAVRARQPDYPPDMSMAGTNSYSHACRVVGYSPGYCVCLHKIAAYERDGTVRGSPDCEKAISMKTCPASSLRQQEREAGKALFYVDRQLLREEMDKRFAAANASFAPTKTTPAPKVTTVTKPQKPAPSVIKDTTDGIHPETNGYAAAINAAIKEAQQQSAPKESVPSPSRPSSLLDVARKHMGNKEA